MKTIKYLPLIAAAFIITSCGLEEDESIEINGSEHSVSISGIKDAFSYSFHSANGAAKAASVPDEVHTLSVKILTENNQVVYEQWYNDWSDSTNNIPDSIFIPSLGAGFYKIYASTSDNYYQYDDYYYQESDSTGGDSAVYVMSDFVIESWSASTNPIYVGNQTFEISDDDVEVVLDMRNISAKITINYSELQHEGYIYASLIGPNAYIYSFEEDDLLLRDGGYESYTDLYFNESRATVNYYFLPRTLNRLRFYVYDYNHDYSIEQSFPLDESLTMDVGDALTVNIDIASLISGSGEGSMSWEGIEWNDLGEITLD